MQWKLACDLIDSGKRIARQTQIQRPFTSRYRIYNAFTNDFFPALSRLTDEVKWKFYRGCVMPALPSGFHLWLKRLWAVGCIRRYRCWTLARMKWRLFDLIFRLFPWTRVEWSLHFILVRKRLRTWLRPDVSRSARLVDHHQCSGHCSRPKFYNSSYFSHSIFWIFRKMSQLRKHLLHEARRRGGIASEYVPGGLDGMNQQPQATCWISWRDFRLCVGLPPVAGIAALPAKMFEQRHSYPSSPSVCPATISKFSIKKMN